MKKLKKSLISIQSLLGKLRLTQVSAQETAKIKGKGGDVIATIDIEF